MPQANYQDVVRNPYALQNNEPGRDHGLWDVLGRAIRSTVPTRANAKFDPNAPVGGENVPYQKPGFFRALAGDRGADMNNAAMQHGSDLGISRGLAGEQAGYNEQESAKREGFLQDLQQKKMDALMGLARVKGGYALDTAEAGARGRRDATLLGNAGREKVARLITAGRLESAKTPRPVSPEQLRWYDSRTRVNNLEVERAEAEKQGLLNPPAKPPGFFQGILNTLSGKSNAPAPGVMRPPIGASVPAPNNSVIKVDPTDLQALGIGNEATGNTPQVPQMFQGTGMEDDDMDMVNGIDDDMDEDDALTNPRRQTYNIGY